MNTKKYLIHMIVLSIFIPGWLFAQNQTSSFQVPATNSHAVIQQRIAATDIEVIYNRPSVKGRTIFGELLKYGHVWRTGSDAATKISFSTPVSINGTFIEAGTYEIFSIPDKTKWTIIIHENRSQWGSYSYDPEYDIARIIATPIIMQNQVETFTISFDDVKTDKATLNFAWENVRVPVEITIDIQQTVLPLLEAALLKEGRRPYFRAAMFYFENNLDIDRAAELMKLALEQNPTHIGMLYRFALILERKGDIEGVAKAACERSLKESASASKELNVLLKKLPMHVN